jgi:segregation and condensation protein B
MKDDSTSKQDDVAQDEIAASRQEDSESADMFAPAQLDSRERAALLVAVLFAAGEVVDKERLSEYIELEHSDLEVLVAEAAGELRHLGLDILPAAGGYKLVTASAWDSYLRQFHRRLRKGRLSKSALEILAVIAYEQPVTRTRVDELRQVNSESTIRTLLDRRLITVARRADTPGRPFLYRTTERFLEIFGLSSLEDLPPKPATLDKAVGVEFGRSGEDTPAGLDELPGFDMEDIADELEN